MPTACVMRMMRTLQTGIWELSRTADKGLLAEMTLISLCREELGEDMASLSARVARLERGIPPVAAPASQPEPAPQPAPEKPKTAAPKPAPQPVANDQPAGDCPFWENLRLVLSDMGYANLLGFLRDVTPSIRGDQLVLTTEQQFCITYLEMPEPMAALTEAAKRAGQKPYKVVLQLITPGLNQDDPLNDLQEIN